MQAFKILVSLILLFLLLPISLRALRWPCSGKGSKRTNQRPSSALDPAIAHRLAGLKRLLPYPNSAALMQPNSQMVQQYAS